MRTLLSTTAWTLLVVGSMGAESAEWRPNADEPRMGNARVFAVGQLQANRTGLVNDAPYTIVNRQGEVSHYVSPETDVDLASHLGDRVGVRGRTAELSDSRALHVVAERVTPLLREDGQDLRLLSR